MMQSANGQCHDLKLWTQKTGLDMEFKYIDNSVLPRHSSSFRPHRDSAFMPSSCVSFQEEILP